MLLDTNILCSYLLGQNDHDSSQRLFQLVETISLRIFITDFSLFSLHLILLEKKEQTLLEGFMQLIRKVPNIRILHTKIDDFIHINRLGLEISLDFDDTIQYYFVKKKKIELVSFDKHFDKTDVRRKEPKEIIDLYKHKG